MTTGPEDLPLRDIHLPDAVSWWPPAPGWWLLLLLICLLIISVAWLIHRRRSRVRSPLVDARELLRKIRDEHANDPDPQRLVRDLSALLRRTAVSMDSRADVASITGEAWLTYLDAYVQDREFSQGVGRILADGPYRKHSK
ncbi:MAG: DUF4381 domain-containing protein, partial [Gammaproteobacteria bacterium]|nr:DUF4381 domain-containing protein [Gammaproteobacteria bacterium]